MDGERDDDAPVRGGLGYREGGVREGGVGEAEAEGKAGGVVDGVHVAVVEEELFGVGDLRVV